jgi:pilus assembly protein Flp/PilA
MRRHQFYLCRGQAKSPEPGKKTKTYMEEKNMNSIKKFVADESGVTAIEYGLIACLIAVVIITAVSLVGTNLEAVFNFIAGKLTTGAAAPAA